jgi:aspartate/methionine/tyrosine aminotransferase
MGLKIGRGGRIPPFIVMDVMREANRLEAAGQAILHLEVGQPSTGAPAKVVAAAAALVGTSALGYTDALGIPGLRERIARHYAETYHVAIDPGRVAVTLGASGAFQLAFLAAFEAGDRVALASPGYPAYRHILTALGLEPVVLDSGPEDRFQPHPRLLDQVAGRLDGLILASPSNPTGTMLDRAALAELAGYCDRRGIRLISDEIYHGITYGEPAATALDFRPDAIVINSFSKYFSMTGWRLGWYLYAELGALGDNSLDFCQRMLRETGVAATADLDFDGQRGHPQIRFSFAGATDDMALAVERLVS